MSIGNQFNLKCTVCKKNKQKKTFNQGRAKEKHLFENLNRSQRVVVWKPDEKFKKKF